MHNPAYSGSPAAALAAHLRRPSTLVLIGLGVAAVVAHAALRFPLRLPGHHGLEWMALLVIARQLASYRWAATITACGAAIASIVAVHDPLAPLMYLVPAAVLDLGWGSLGEARRGSALWLGALAGLAHAVKPLVQWGTAAAFGLAHHGGASLGLFDVVAMHAAFGLAGGVTGALLWRASRR